MIIYEKGKDQIMAVNKIQEAAWNLTETILETSQKIANSAVAAQERDMRFVQNSFDNGMEVLKSSVADTRTLIGGLVEQPQKVQGRFQAITGSAIAAQERNVKFVQTVAEEGFEALQSQAESTRFLTQELMKQSQKQLGAFQVLAHESVDAYIEFFNTPFSYYNRALETAESLAG
jgi:DNA mismatch repair ATPase MutS